MPKEELDWDRDDWPRKRSRQRDDDDEEEEDYRPRKRKRKVRAARRSSLPLVLGLLCGGMLLLLVVGGVVAVMLLGKGNWQPDNAGVANGPPVVVPPELIPPPAVPRVPGPPPPQKPLPPAITPPGHHMYECDYFSVCVKGEFGESKAYKEPPPFPKIMLWYAPTPSYVAVQVSRVDAAFLADYQRDWAGALDRLLVRDLGVRTVMDLGTYSWSDCTLAGFEGRQLKSWIPDVPVAQRGYGFSRFIVKGDLLFKVIAPPTRPGGVNNPDTDAMFDSFRVK